LVWLLYCISWVEVRGSGDVVFGMVPSYE